MNPMKLFGVWLSLGEHTVLIAPQCPLQVQVSQLTFVKKSGSNRFGSDLLTGNTQECLAVTGSNTQESHFSEFNPLSRVLSKSPSSAFGLSLRRITASSAPQLSYNSTRLPHPLMELLEI